VPNYRIAQANHIALDPPSRSRAISPLARTRGMRAGLPRYLIEFYLLELLVNQDKVENNSAKELFISLSLTFLNTESKSVSLNL